MDTYSEHVARISTALADPTRREIMDHVLDADSPLSVREVAEYFGLHANAARMHLDKLVKGGLLRIVRRRGKSGGRPANLYSASEEERELHLPARSYKLLAEVLAGAISGLEGGVDIHMGDEAFARGREEAVRSSSPLAFLSRGSDLEEVARVWLEEVSRRGLRARMVAGDRGHAEVTFLACPFGDFPRNHPDLVCEIHRRLEEGFLSLTGDWQLEKMESGCTFILRPRRRKRRR